MVLKLLKISIILSLNASLDIYPIVYTIQLYQHVLYYIQMICEEVM